jgi:hypothetical protein
VAALDGNRIRERGIMADIERGRPPRDLAAKMRVVATNAGIIPGDPLAPVLEVLADIPDEVDLRIAPAVARIEQAIVQINAAAAAANRPLMTSSQIRQDVLPGVLTAVSAGQAIATAVLLLLMFAMGFGTRWWITPAGPPVAGVTAGTEKCEDRPDGSRLCWIPVWQRLPPAALR